jgi:hypothetical protein
MQNLKIKIVWILMILGAHKSYAVADNFSNGLCDRPLETAILDLTSEGKDNPPLKFEKGQLILNSKSPVLKAYKKVDNCHYLEVMQRAPAVYYYESRETKQFLNKIKVCHTGDQITITRTSSYIENVDSIHNMVGWERVFRSSPSLTEACPIVGVSLIDKSGKFHVISDSVYCDRIAKAAASFPQKSLTQNANFWNRVEAEYEKRSNELKKEGKIFEEQKPSSRFWTFPLCVRDSQFARSGDAKILGDKSSSPVKNSAQ